MPFDRPTLTELIARIKTDIESRLDGADASLRRTLLAIVATIEAGAVHGLYGYLDWIANQVLPDTAESEILDRWASIWGVTRKQPSKASTDSVTMAGTDGSVISKGTVWVRADGAEYQTMAAVSLQGGTAVAPLEALQTGKNGNTDGPVKLTLDRTVSGVKSVAEANRISGGADRESDADLRTRVLARIRQAPHGGADFDYRMWALEVSGVTRVWVYPKELGAGTVTVRIMTDGATDNGIPDAKTVQAVQAHLDMQRPVTAEVFAVAPVPAPLNMTINISPNTDAVRAAVAEELNAMLARDGVPGATVLLSHLREAISVATGEADHQLVAPVDDVSHTTGQLPILGTITWGAMA